MAGSLPIALAESGDEVSVILPLYGQIKDEWRKQMSFCGYIYVDLGWRHQYCGLFSLTYRGVTVEKGATVENSVLFKGTTVRSGAVLRCVIADKNVTFNENVTLMGHEHYPVVVAKDTEV